MRDAAMTRRHVVAWHKEKYLTASMRRFITLCRSAAEKVGKAVNFIVKGRTMCALRRNIPSRSFSIFHFQLKR